MTVSPKHLILGAALAVIALTASCTTKDGEVLYCNPDDQSWLQRRGAMHINLERRLIYGDDTSSAIYPFVRGDFAGFEGEFPLLLFSDAADLTEVPGNIIVNDIVFQVSSVEGSFGDLWLITAQPRIAGSKQGSRQRSTVLYSAADGVLAIGGSAFLGEEVFPINYVPCGKRTLRYEDVRSLSDG